MVDSLDRSADEIREVVRDRYAEIARDGSIANTGAADSPAPRQIAEAVGYTADDTACVPDGANLGVGCGAPHALAAIAEGETVLDLGSGAGFDVFLAARAAGPTGTAIGVDMTDEMLDKARANARQGGFENVEFRKGYLEALPIDDDSIDVVISNCVINLVPDKAVVYREIARVLRPGGRVVISDVVIDAPLPEVIASDVAALTGCAAGASLRPDYLETIAAAGLAHVEVLDDKCFGSVLLTMVPPELLAKVENAGIDVQATIETVRSLTIRAQKP